MSWDSPSCAPAAWPITSVPLVATNEPTAVAVMQEAAAALSGPVVIDVPDDRPLLRQALADAGFAPQRGFARMATGHGGTAHSARPDPFHPRRRRPRVRLNRPRRPGASMPLHRSDLPDEVLSLLAQGAVIPAHPLALNAQRQFDRQRQRALTRYYVDAGAGGLAVGVHTTQFSIREHGLYETVLRSAMQDRLAWSRRPMVMIAGLCGGTQQARAEARTAVGLGYHAGLLSLAALAGSPEDQLIAHCEAVAQEIPLVGFYLQTAVGGPGALQRFLAPFRVDPECAGDQGRAVQPLSHPRRGARRCRRARRRAGLPVHRQ